jgi:hypothetical protein
MERDHALPNGVRGRIGFLRIKRDDSENICSASKKEFRRVEIVVTGYPVDNSNFPGDRLITLSWENQII